MSENLPFITVRAVFEKTGSAMWFSHLDLSRAVSRALRRSKLDVWMTQGFTPRVHLVFTPPLSLGFESRGEIMEFRLNLNAKLDKTALIEAMPPCLKIKEVYLPDTKLKEIMYADYTISFDSDCDTNAVTNLFSKPLMMIKKTKRSESETDITRFIKSFECRRDGARVTINTTLLCSTESLSPSYILSALSQNGIDTDRVLVCRNGFRRENLEIFR